MRRIPIFATLVVALAVAVMVALGLWQLDRARWKEALLARYSANAGRPALVLPAKGQAEAHFYRHASGRCAPPLSWSARAGQNRAGEGGWRHVALCGNGLAVDLGWSKASDAPVGYAGGSVAGVLDADRDHGLLLVATRPAPGLLPSRVPTPADIPNNHRGYAAQWFIFAGVAVVIYGLALGRRRRQKLAADAAHG